jgi:hypothetical protein
MSEIVRFSEMNDRFSRPAPMDFSHINAKSAKFAFGSDGASDTLSALRAANGTSIAGYGLDNAYQGIALYLAAQNVITSEMISDFCGMGTDEQRAFGSVTSGTMVMEEMDADGKPASQKTTAGVTVGFPLRRYAIGVSWNYQYFANNTPADMAVQVQAMATADRQRIQKEIKAALFGNLNYAGSRGTGNYDFRDFLGKGVHLPVKKILNADGLAIPPGPNGEIFDGTTHTHFLWSQAYWPTSTSVATLSALSASTPTTTNNDLLLLTKHVREHNAEGALVIYINQNQEPDIRLTPGFTALQYQGIVPRTTIDVQTGYYDPNNINNRWIGNFQGAQVWVKPWIPTDYILCFFISGAEPPLMARTPDSTLAGKTAGGDLAGGPGDLRIVQDSANHPLYAMALERQIGFGAWNRWNSAVMFVSNSSANSATSYTPPSL